MPIEFGGWEELGYIPDAPAEPAKDQWLRDLQAADARRDSGATPPDDNSTNDRHLSKVDIADRAFAQSRARTILHIHPKLKPTDVDASVYEKFLEKARKLESELRVKDFIDTCEQSGAPQDDEDLGRSLFASEGGWRGSRIKRLIEPKPPGTLARYPDGITWISALHPDRANGMPPLPISSFGDEQDDLSRTGKLDLRQHLADVYAEANRLTKFLSLPQQLTETVLVSAKLHDLGKADPRFQAMLLGQPVSVAYMQRTLWAKSDRFGGSQESELPSGFRHEMLTLDLLDRFDFDAAVDDDLLRHLEASHHGYARPFAPLAVDDELPGFNLDALELQSVSREERVDWIPSYQLDSGIADRFWRLNRRFGWWGLAYLESLLRLADWSASARPKRGDMAELNLPREVSTDRPTPSEPAIQGIVLSGIDGSRPLGFLSALGTFRTLASCLQETDLRYSWKLHEGAWRPVLHFASDVEWNESKVIETLLEHLETDLEKHLALTISPPEQDRRDYFAKIAEAASLKDRLAADWLSCNQSDAAAHTAISQLQTSRRDYHSIAIQGLLDSTKAEHLWRTLFEPWDYSDPIAGVSLHLEPREDRRHAYQWHTPSGDPTRKTNGGMIGANRLALEAWPLFQSLPAAERDRMRTTSFTGTRVTDTRFSWPIWSTRISLPTVAGVLALQATQNEKLHEDDIARFGIVQVYRCKRILVGKTPNLTTAVAVAT